MKLALKSFRPASLRNHPIKPTKSIIGLAVGLAALSASAQTPEMQPIEKFVQDNVDSSNGSTEVFVGLRCYSIFMILHVYTKENGLAEISEKYYSGAQTFLEIAIENQNPKNQAFILDQTERMTDLYKERFLEAKARTGNTSDDPLISADVRFCSYLLSP